MASPSSPKGASAPGDASVLVRTSKNELLSEILSAEADFERGDYIDLTPEQLACCIETGEFPWPDEFPRLSTTFRRTLTAIGVRPRSVASRAVFATIGAPGNAALLPGPGDFETPFAPGRGHGSSAGP